MSTSALRNRNFLIYLSGALVSLHGLWIYRVALGWSAWELTGSELWVGIVAFTQFAPAVVFGPLFGVLADRFDRRRASILVNTGSAINMAVLATVTITGNLDIALLTASSIMQGTLDGAHTPIRMTLVPSLVNREQLQSAIASNSIAFNVSRFVGPAIAGIIIASFGVGTAFAVNSVSYLAIVAAVFAVTLNPRKRRQKAPGAVWAEIMDGVRYVASHATIRGLLLIVAIASVFGRGALEMLPAFADAVFERGASGLAILTSAVGVGSIATGLVLAQRGRWLDARVVRWTVVVAGLFIIAFGLIDAFWLAVPVVTALGIILALCGVGSQILIQSLVDDEVRGRVSSLWGMIAFGGTAFGSIIVGSASALFGLQLTVIVTGAVCAAAAFAAGRS
jgi:MFS family permease